MTRWLACLVALGPAAPEESFAVRGRVKLAVTGVSIGALRPAVAYLDAREGRLEFAAPREPARISQHKARFTPAFLVVCAGQAVEMPNDDSITHNVFSYSKPNAFDLGLYPKGERRSVTLAHPGVVRIYCSIHKSMKGTIFVAPSPYSAVVDSEGSFEIRGVPAGSYLLKLWSDVVPEASREIEVRGGGDGPVEIEIAEKK